MTVRALSMFDPGPSDPNRWDTALASAIADTKKTAGTIEVDGFYELHHGAIIDAPLMTFEADPAVGGFHWTQTGDCGLALFAPRIRVIGLTLRGPTPYDGLDDVGIVVAANGCELADLSIRGWGGNGLEVDGQQANANGGHYARLRFDSCGQSASSQRATSGAVYVHGSDAGGGSFSAVSAFDSRRGFLDLSLIGNPYTTCAVEGCNDRRFVAPGAPVTGYGFIFKSPSGRCVARDCYQEMDSESDIDSPNAVEGGTVTNRGTATVGPSGTSPRFAVSQNTGALPVGVTLGGDERGALLSTYVSGSRQYTLYADRPSGWASLNAGGITNEDALRIKGAVSWFPRDTMHGWPTGASGRRTAYRESLEQALAQGPDGGGPWWPGDRIEVLQPALGQPSAYVAVRVGGVVQWAVAERLGTEVV